MSASSYIAAGFVTSPEPETLDWSKGGKVMNKKVEKKLDSEVEVVVVKDKNGKIVSIGHEKNKVPHGEYTWYNEDSTVYAKAVYDNGKIISYDVKDNEKPEYENGLLVKKPGLTEYDREYYSDNRLVKARYYYPTGRVFKTVDYVGNGVSEVKIYNQDGTPNIAGFRKDDGTRVRRWTEYYFKSNKVYQTTDYDDNGKEVEITKYFKDTENVSWHKKIYDEKNWELEEYINSTTLERKVIVKDGFETHYGFTCDGILYHIYHYDENGRLHGQQIEYLEKEGKYFGEEKVQEYVHGTLMSETKRIM